MTLELCPEEEAALAANTRLYSRDLAPTPRSDRTWTAYNYGALWMGMAHCMPTWLMAGSLFKLGLNWWRVVLAIGLGSGLVLVPILLNSHPGTRYGIPFPVLARASFGVAGANVPALLRALVAAGWFGINTYIGGQAVQTLVVRLVPGWEGLDRGFQLAGMGLGSWLTFLAFWALNLWVIYHGMTAVRRFEAWAGPAVIVLALGLLAWAYQAAGGWGPILAQPARVSGGLALWTIFGAGVMAAVNFWATLSLNIPDFTRFARSQRSPTRGWCRPATSTRRRRARWRCGSGSGTAAATRGRCWSATTSTWSTSSPGAATTPSSGSRPPAPASTSSAPSRWTLPWSRSTACSRPAVPTASSWGLPTSSAAIGATSS